MQTAAQASGTEAKLVRQLGYWSAVGLVIGVTMYRAIPLFQAMQARIDRINQVMRETLAGVRVIRAFVRTRHEEGRFAVANQDVFDAGLRVNRMFAVTIPVLTAIMNLATVAVMWFGAMRINDGALRRKDRNGYLPPRCADSSGNGIRKTQRKPMFGACSLSVTPCRSQATQCGPLPLTTRWLAAMLRRAPSQARSVEFPPWALASACP